MEWWQWVYYGAFALGALLFGIPAFFEPARFLMMWRSSRFYDRSRMLRSLGLFGGASVLAAVFATTWPERVAMTIAALLYGRVAWLMLHEDRYPSAPGKDGERRSV